MIKYNSDLHFPLTRTGTVVLIFLQNRNRNRRKKKIGTRTGTGTDLAIFSTLEPEPEPKDFFGTADLCSSVQHGSNCLPKRITLLKMSMCCVLIHKRKTTIATLAQHRFARKPDLDQHCRTVHEKIKCQNV